MLFEFEGKGKKWRSHKVKRLIEVILGQKRPFSKTRFKYFGRCNNEMFDSIFGNQVCKWQEALGIDQKLIISYES